MRILSVTWLKLADEGIRKFDWCRLHSLAVAANVTSQQMLQAHISFSAPSLGFRNTATEHTSKVLCQSPTCSQVWP